MAIIGALDRTNHFSEFNDPLPNNAGGYTSPAARKSEARSNLNIAAAFTEHLMDVAFGEQPLIAQQAPQAFNTTGTLTAANMLAFMITSTTAANVDATLPTGSNLETSLLAAYPTLAALDSFDLTVINTGGTNAFSLLTNTGWTLVGNMTVAGADKSGQFRIRRTAANTYVCYRIS